MRQACNGPAPPNGTSANSRRSKPRSVEIDLTASPIWTSMIFTWPSAASSRSMPSGSASPVRTASSASDLSILIAPPRREPESR